MLSLQVNWRVFPQWTNFQSKNMRCCSMYLRPLSEKTMATRSSTLAWRIPCTEEPGRLQSMGSPRVGRDWATSPIFTFLHWKRKWQLTPVSWLENPRDGGAWWAAVYGVAQSQTQLNRLSSSNSSSSRTSLISFDHVL